MIPPWKELWHFQKTVWGFFQLNRRQFTWRSNTDPYWVFVSEVMLQQTQTGRVAEKFPQFLQAFPDFNALASVGLADVLASWQGLGYNRRAKFLHQSAMIIRDKFIGNLPADEASLLSLPGIGKNTAASIQAFAFNIPTVFVETNIRTVFIHHFFPSEITHDRQILELVEATIDLKRPREWYWALMDYGVHLKKTVGNLSRQSSHYLPQSRFSGSVRQIRGSIVRHLLQKPSSAISEQALRKGIAKINPNDSIDERYTKALQGLVEDGLVVCDNVSGESLYRIV